MSSWLTVKMVHTLLLELGLKILVSLSVLSILLTRMSSCGRIKKSLLGFSKPERSSSLPKSYREQQFHVSA